MIQQLLYFLGSIITIPLLPILYIMGKNVRNNVPQLPEASGNIVGKIAGNNTVINLLTLGESSMAGVGVTDHTNAITGQIAKTINDTNGSTVCWQVLARNGYTAEKVNSKLIPKIPLQAFDIIVIGLGGNDTFKLNSPLTFKKNIFSVINNIQKLQPKAKIIIVNMPPIAYFPAFPWLMQFILGNLVSLHGSIIGTIPTVFKNVHYMSEPISFEEQTNKNPDMFDYFSDGVHPSALTYKIWGEDIGNFILSKI